MRLLNTRTRELESFSSNIPPYATLSHTWGPVDEEISYQDMSGPHREWSSNMGPPKNSTKETGWDKLNGACRQALSDGVDYIWIDTCCIDKSSSAELSEAINSMFAWYAQSQVCYAYLADVRTPEVERDWESSEGEGDWESSGKPLRRSRWFTRGWTLQELLAPRNLEFFDKVWSRIGSKSDLCDIVSQATGIDKIYIHGPEQSHDRHLRNWHPERTLSRASVGQRMSWAAKRVTTRVEDKAYCLLGIFDISMPMLYGEGDKAFARLQEAIMLSTDDCTLLAWGFESQGPCTTTDDDTPPSILAPEPKAFQHLGEIITRALPQSQQTSFSMGQRGMRLMTLVVGDKLHSDLAYAVLGCGPSNPPYDEAPQDDPPYEGRPWEPVPTQARRLGLMVIPLQRLNKDEYCRLPWLRPMLVTAQFAIKEGIVEKVIEIIIKRPSIDYHADWWPRTPIYLQSEEEIPGSFSELENFGTLHTDAPWPTEFLRETGKLDLDLIQAYPPWPIELPRHDSNDDPCFVETGLYNLEKGCRMFQVAFLRCRFLLVLQNEALPMIEVSPGGLIEHIRVRLYRLFYSPQLEELMRFHKTEDFSELIEWRAVRKSRYNEHLVLEYAVDSRVVKLAVMCREEMLTNERTHDISSRHFTPVIMVMVSCRLIHLLRQHYYRIP